jgi:oligopeptide/dipeptide ABC transporter ATP-binding protein
MSTPSQPALLDVRGLTVHFQTAAGTIRAVDGVDLTVARGETLALVGESGCGKSTLARAVMGLETPRAGSMSFDGRPLDWHRDRAALSRGLQMIFQDPDASLNPRMTLHDAIAEPLSIHSRVNKAQRTERVCEIMRSVGLDPALRNRYPHELSGGQRQRVCIARVLAVEPKLIVCDEAVSALDVSVQAQILNLLSDLKQRLGLAYLFITHDLGVVRNVADRVAVMYLGRIFELGTTDALLDDPKNPYTAALLEAVPRLTARTVRAPLQGDVPSPLNPPSGCRFHTRCPKVFERCPRQEPELYAVPEGASRCWLAEPSQREL